MRTRFRILEQIEFNRDPEISHTHEAHTHTHSQATQKNELIFDWMSSVSVRRTHRNAINCWFSVELNWHSVGHLFHCTDACDIATGLCDTVWIIIARIAEYLNAISVEWRSRLDATEIGRLLSHIPAVGCSQCQSRGRILIFLSSMTFEPNEFACFNISLFKSKNYDKKYWAIRELQNNLRCRRNSDCKKRVLLGYF